MGLKRTGVRGPELDAGLHTETDAGPIDVGMALSSSSAGMVIDAPGLGMLRVAFEVGDDGSVKLTALSRKSKGADLFGAPLLVMDKARVEVLEAQVAAALAAQQQA